MLAVAEKLPVLAGQATDPKTIIALYLTGQDSSQISRQLGITRQALSQWLLKHSEDDWKTAQHVMAEERKARANDTLDQARDDLEACTDIAQTTLYLARVRAAEASLKSAQWELERVSRRIYGDLKTEDSAGRVAININLGVAGAPQIAIEAGNQGPVIEHDGTEKDVTP